MRILGVLIFAFGCVSESKEVSSALDSERCGTLTKKQSEFEFQDGVSGKGRLLDAQDKSVQARLDEFVASKGNLCITADLTAAKEVVLKSSNVIREAQVNQRTEECGTSSSGAQPDQECEDHQSPDQSGPQTPQTGRQPDYQGWLPDGRGKRRCDVLLPGSPRHHSLMPA